MVICQRWCAYFFMVLGGSLITSAQTNATLPSPTGIRYGVIGDSYSNGEGAMPSDAWPTRLTAHLVASGISVKLVANPSVTGWTTRQALDIELPAWKSAKPDFATLQIGVNDWVQGVKAVTFRQHFAQLLDEMLKVLPDKRRLLIVNIPDFSVTPTGAAYGGGRDISRGLADFNQIIQQEAARRQLNVVDVYTLSRSMATDRALTARDGLHPSAKEYALWEQVIFPSAHEMLTKTSP